MVTEISNYVSHSHELPKRLNEDASMSTMITAVPSSIAKCNEKLIYLFDFRRDLHE